MLQASIIIGVLLYFILLPYQFWADGMVRFNFISEFIDKGILTPMKYSMIGPIFSIPLAWADYFTKGHFFLLRYNLILLCMASFVIYKLLNKKFSHQFLITFTAILFFGSMYPGNITQYYGEVFSSLTAFIGIVMIAVYNAPLGWILLILSVSNTPITIIPLLIITFYIILKSKKPILFLIPIVTSVLLILESKIRMPRTLMGFSNYLLDDRGYISILPYSGKPGFSYPMFLGIINILFSSGKGLLFFSPGLILIPELLKHQININLRKIIILSLLYSAGLIIAYSKWWAWYGGWFWGPRFFLFASIPASLSLAYLLTIPQTPVKLKITSAVILVWSFWVGINGIIFGLKNLDICTGNNYAYEHLCWHVPEFSVLLRPFISPSKLMITDYSFIILFIIILLIILVNAFKKTKNTNKYLP